MTVGFILGVGVTLNGIYEAWAVDKRQDPVLTWVYCLSPILCFPVFFLVRSHRKSAVLLALLALAFLGAYSALNWRTCAELGYCASLASTVLETLQTFWVLAFFGVAAISFVAATIENRSLHLNQRNRIR
jgi:hypothetical protein